MHQEIEQRAYALWEADGRPEGMDKSYWFKAVAQIAEEKTRAIRPVRPKRTRIKKAA